MSDCKIAHDGFCEVHETFTCFDNKDTEVQTISYKDFILLEACKTQWPSLREKMEAAKLLNELKE